MDGEKELMEKDARVEYWRRWQKIKGRSHKTVPKALKDERMSELNSEPLLLHLLINSDFIGKKWEQAAENRNVVYIDILTKIYEREKSKEGNLPVKDLSEEDFFTLMECLGLAAWRGNGRTGSDEDFEQLRDEHAKHRKKRIQEAGRG